MDGEVRVTDADRPLGNVGSSHTMHNDCASSQGVSALAEPPQDRRDRLIAATVEVVSEGSVDRLAQTRDTA